MIRISDVNYEKSNTDVWISVHKPSDYDHRVKSIMMIHYHIQHIYTLPYLTPSMRDPHTATRPHDLILPSSLCPPTVLSSHFAFGSNTFTSPNAAAAAIPPTNSVEVAPYRYPPYPPSAPLRHVNTAPLIHITDLDSREISLESSKYKQHHPGHDTAY